MYVHSDNIKQLFVYLPTVETWEGDFSMKERDKKRNTAIQTTLNQTETKITQASFEDYSFIVAVH